MTEARRAIILVKVDRVADACGYGVPQMSYEDQREHMEAWAQKKMRTGGAAALDAYVAEKNTVSIDGPPAVNRPGATAP